MNQSSNQAQAIPSGFLTRFSFLILLLSLSFALFAQKGDEDAEMFNRSKKRDQQAIDEAVNGWWTQSMKTVDQRIAWWREARFGMFVHWGVYSLPGGEWKGKVVNGYAEHLMRKEKVPRAEYLEMAHLFNPVEFNADEWIRTARDAGMRYFVITAKHHDGFAMYPSEVSDYNITKQTAFKRDPMAELAAACKKYGVKFGFYYSHAFDWEHPDAPGNDWEYDNPGGDLLLHGGANWFDAEPQRLPKAVKYVNEKAILQIKELIHKYHPDILWFDTPHKIPLSENIRILKIIRETDPNVVVNGRLARSSSVMFGDYKNTADRPAEFFPVEGDWEAIPTTNESYGYSKFDQSHKPVSFFIRLLANAVSRNGNLLMNIGPMGNGSIDAKDLQILKGIGTWMTKNGESIHGAKSSPLPLQTWGVVTQKVNKLYLHVFDWPENGSLDLGGLKSDFKKAYFLSEAGKSAIKVSRINSSDLRLTVPSIAPDPINTVIVLETEGVIQSDSVRLLAGNHPIRLLAFDANLHGKGLKFGDGKAKRFYVENWKTVDQWFSWDVRLNEPAQYKIEIKFTGSKGSGGKIKLEVGDQILEAIIPEKQELNEVNSFAVGTIKLKKGVSQINLKPISFGKDELIKLLEVQLTPVK
jgi:alpha-L-fucosidase